MWEARVLFVLGVTFFTGFILFSCSKVSDANIGIIANFVSLQKNSTDTLVSTPFGAATVREQ